jgi:hypothetical protein
MCLPYMDGSEHLLKLVFKYKYANLITWSGKGAQLFFPVCSMSTKIWSIGDKTSDGSEKCANGF